MNDRRSDLCIYRYHDALQTLKIARLCLEQGSYKDAINRSYYAAFYALKAVLALSAVDFKRHKDVVVYFNKEYVATLIFPRELGRKLGQLKQMRETSDYDDFFIASVMDAADQIEAAQLIVDSVKIYISQYVNLPEDDK